MSSAAVGRSLFRACMRWAKHVEGVPFALRPFDVIALCPARAALPAANTFDGSAQVEYLARTAFRECMHDQGEAAASAMDNCITALQLLTSDYGEKVQRMRELRESRIDRSTAAVEYSVGQVFKHKVYGYRGVVYGWDPKCEREPQWAAAMKVEAEQPFYHVLPDEMDCNRLFKAVRISKYVAQSNVELLPSGQRCMHRALPNYFTGYDELSSRYVPNARLAYEYPDESYEGLGPVLPLGIDGTPMAHEDPAVELAASEHFLRAALAGDHLE